jgi:hypothetical protein
LFSVVDFLKELHAVVIGLKTLDLDKTEAIRLRGIIVGCKIYNVMIIEYRDCRGLEAELLDLRETFASLAKNSSGHPGQKVVG